MPVDKSDDRVRRMFGQNRRAVRFPESPAVAGHRSLLAAADGAARAAASGPLPILDVCTGTGDLALAYDRAASGRTPIVAADFCHEMLAIGRQKAHRGRRRRPRSRSSKPTPNRCRCPAMRFKSSASRSACATWPTPTAAWPKWSRVAAPGGRVAVLEFSTPTRQPFKAIYGWYFRHVLPRIGQLFARNSADAYEYLPASVGEFPQGEAAPRAHARRRPRASCAATRSPSAWLHCM